jgi:hypothetical protein
MLRVAPVGQKLSLIFLSLIQPGVRNSLLDNFRPVLMPTHNFHLFWSTPVIEDEEDLF